MTINGIGLLRIREKAGSRFGNIRSALECA
jgi:hypothetical protein